MKRPCRRFTRRTSNGLRMARSLGLALAVVSPVAMAAPVEGRIDARLMRQADVSDTQIAFVYAGDIWVAPKSGGTAVRLSSPRGEESFPRFSPDGTQIAFSGNYDGNLDLYVMPATGGLPKRLTYHGAPDRLLDWYPDGQSLLIATSRTSEKDRFNQLYRVPLAGGLPEKLPMPYGEFGSLSPDGRFLAYTPISIDFPHVEAVPGRHDPRHLDLRSSPGQGREHHPERQRRRTAAVARRDDLFPVRSRRPQTGEPLGLPRGHQGHAPAHVLQGFRRAFPGDRPQGTGPRERGAALPP
ncbi:MAG: hypothetical protein M5U12_00595 [Verrucomicrobia bacterium]|nr:hypothetical protein [Verrucomicrobiota bacterium]